MSAGKMRGEVERYLSGRIGTGLLLCGNKEDDLLKEARQAASGLLRVSEERLDAHPDFLFLSAPDGKMGVAEASEVTGRAQWKPSVAEKIVVLIDGMDILTVPAQNKLLKLIEEDGNVVIVATSHGGEILPTIRSRLQVIEACPETLYEYISGRNRDGRKTPGDPAAEYYASDRLTKPFDEKVIKLFTDTGKCLKSENPADLLRILHLVREKDPESVFTVHRSLIPSLLSYMGHILLERGEKEAVRLVIEDCRRSSSTAYTKDDFFALIARVLEAGKGQSMKSLYELERPSDFRGVVGQDAIVKSLEAAVRSGKYANSYLFVGYAGCGKTTLARILARHITQGDSNSIRELDAASNNGVEQIRAIIDDTNFAALGGRKVYILDEVHMLSQGASNALLKTLENPPEGVTFILCTTEEDKVIDTIKSRSRIFRLKRISPDLIQARLKEICEKYGKAAIPDALALIAAKCGGSMRNALTIMEPLFDADEIYPKAVEEHLGILPADSVFDILDAVATGDTGKALEAMRVSLSEGRSAMNLVRALLQAINDTESVFLGTPCEMIVQTGEYRERASRLASGLQNTAIMDGFASGLKDIIRYSSKMDADICLELIIRENVCETSLSVGLMKRVSELEKRVSELESRPLSVEKAPEADLGAVESFEPPAEPAEDSFPVPEPDDDTDSYYEEFEDIEDYEDIIEQYGEAADPPEEMEDFPFEDEGIFENDVPEESGEKLIPFAPDMSPEEEQPGEDPIEPVEKVVDITQHLPEGIQSNEMSAADFFGDDDPPAGDAAMPLNPEEDPPLLDFAGFLW